MDQEKSITYTHQSPSSSLPLDNNLQSSLYTFKEEILNAVRDIESRMKSSHLILQDDINSKLSQYEKQFNSQVRSHETQQNR
jgi:hypothetical protein